MEIKKTRIFLIAGIVISIAVIMVISQNNNLQVTKLSYSNAEIPIEFNGFKICHISDLHSKEFGKNQAQLLDKITENSPDLIVITGDLVDRRRYDLDAAMRFINKAVDVALVYYVSGNHEAWSDKYAHIKATLLQSGVTVLDNEAARITLGDGAINILGLSDPDFLTESYLQNTDTSMVSTTLEGWSSIDGFNILLSHRPELYSLYAKHNMDLIFSGHAHGGQFRIPFIGGIAAPDQGLFPKYTSGFYIEENSTMFVSRGLGNSIFPLRINNNPEIAIITLHADN